MFTREDITDRFNLEGKTAIVTGASPGIGARVAQANAAFGANVALAQRNPQKVRALADEINARGVGKALPGVRVNAMGGPAYAAPNGQRPVTGATEKTLGSWAEGQQKHTGGQS